MILFEDSVTVRIPGCDSTENLRIAYTVLSGDRFAIDILYVCDLHKPEIISLHVVAQIGFAYRAIRRDYLMDCVRIRLNTRSG